MKFIIFFSAEGDINDVLIKTLAEAHANTNIKLEVVHEMFRKPQVGLVLVFCTVQTPAGVAEVLINARCHL